MKTSPIWFALASCLTVVLAAAGPASATMIVVTTKNDVVADDGRCSLREAVSAANKNVRSGTRTGECPAGDRSFVDLIQLRRETYELERTPIGEDQNAGGDLDVTGSVVIQGKGRRTIVANGLGDPEVAGDGDRIFHVDPAGVGGVDVIFSRVTLTRGDVACSGRFCDMGGSAVDARGSGSLTFEGCTVLRNFATCFGEDCGTSISGSAIQTIFGGSLTIRNTTIKKNETWCATKGCAVGAVAITMTTDGGVAVAADLDPPSSALVLDGSTVTQNESWCEGAGCGAGGIVSTGSGALAARAVAFTLNEIGCFGDDCEAGSIVHAYVDGRNALADDVELSENYGACDGKTCSLGAVLAFGSDGSAALRGAKLRQNEFSCEGDGCSIATHYDVGGFVDATIEDVEQSSESIACSGAGCRLGGLLRVESAGGVNAVEVRMTDTHLVCEGIGCTNDGLAQLSGAPVLSAGNTLRDSISGCVGDDCQAGSLLGFHSVGDATVRAVGLHRNIFGCAGERCNASDAVRTSLDGGITFAEMSLGENTVTCSGTRCTVSDLLGAYASSAVVVETASLEMNSVECDGESCAAGGLGTLDAERVSVDLGTVRDNDATCEGDFCRVTALLKVRTGEGSISRSTFGTNGATCDGEECAAGPGGALRSTSKELTVVDTTFVLNVTDGYGAAIFNDAGSELRLERSLLSDNQAGLRGTMEFGGFGGALFNDAANGRLGIVRLGDTLIRTNRALRSGGGILNEGTIAQLVNSSISGNSIGDCVNRGGTGCP